MLHFEFKIAMSACFDSHTTISTVLDLIFSKLNFVGVSGRLGPRMTENFGKMFTFRCQNRKAHMLLVTVHNFILHTLLGSPGFRVEAVYCWVKNPLRANLAANS